MLRYEYEKSGNYIGYVFDDLRFEVLKRHKTAKKELLEELNKRNWEHFWINEIFSLLSAREQKYSVTLNDNQIKKIEEWCLKNSKKIDFNKALKKNEKGGFSVNTYAIYLWFFLKKYSFKYDKEILLDMISFDHMTGIGSFGGISYLNQ